MRVNKKKEKLTEEMDAQAMNLIDLIRVIYSETIFADLTLSC